MSAFQNRCEHCHEYYEAQRSTSRFCCDAHRVAAGRVARAADFRAQEWDLLTRQSRAIREADAAALALVDADARALLGLAYPQDKSRRRSAQPARINPIQRRAKQQCSTFRCNT